MSSSYEPTELDLAESALHFAQTGLDDAIENYINARIKSDLATQKPTEKKDD